MGRDDGEGIRPIKRIKLEDFGTSASSAGNFSVGTPYQGGALREACAAAGVCESGSSNPSKMMSAGKSKVPTQDDEFLGSEGQIRKKEYIRLITQALYELGCHRSAALLEEESGVPVQAKAVADFRTSVLEGRWEDCCDYLEKLHLDDEEMYKSTLFLILEEKYLELLEQGEVMRALEVLRTRLEPLKMKTVQLHRLAALAMCPSGEDLRVVAGWAGASAVSRRRLLADLQVILPPTMMVPERRLEGLVEQALEIQRANCYYHNTQEKAFCLFVDHLCGRDQIPTETLQVLEEHTDEVWYVQFSHDGTKLASASKDMTIIIWQVLEDEHVEFQRRLEGLSPSFMAWSPDDSLLLTCCSECLVKLWRVETGDCICTIGKHTEPVLACAWLPDGLHFVTGGGRDMFMWNTEGCLVNEWKEKMKVKVVDLAISADGRHMLSVWGDNEVRVYSFEEQLERRFTPSEKPTIITSLSLSSDGRFFLLNTKMPAEIQLWDLGEPGQALELRRLPEGPSCKYQGHKQAMFVIRSCFGGSDHAFIVSGSEDSQVYIWQRESGELLEVLPGHAGTVNTVCWNPVNPHMFASASDDHTVRIWGVAKKKKERKPTGTGQGHANGVGPLISNGYQIKEEES